MAPYLPMVVYCVSVALAIGLLYRFDGVKWIWHALSLLAAFAIGFAPTPQGLDSPFAQLVTGSLIVFLLFWGVGGLLLNTLPHREKHA